MSLICLKTLSNLAVSVLLNAIALINDAFTSSTYGSSVFFPASPGPAKLNLSTVNSPSSDFVTVLMSATWKGTGTP